MEECEKAFQAQTGVKDRRTWFLCWNVKGERDAQLCRNRIKEDTVSVYESIQGLEEAIELINKDKAKL